MVVWEMSEQMVCPFGLVSDDPYIAQLWEVLYGRSDRKAQFAIRIQVVVGVDDVELWLFHGVGSHSSVCHSLYQKAEREWDPYLEWTGSIDWGVLAQE